MQAVVAAVADPWPASVTPEDICSFPSMLIDGSDTNKTLQQTNLSATIILFPVSTNWHGMSRLWQLAHGSSPEHLILLFRHAEHLFPS